MKTIKQITKVCGICKNLIYLKKDTYVHMIDYFEGKFHSESYFHNKCNHDKIDNAITRNKEKLMGSLKNYIHGVHKKYRDNLDGNDGGLVVMPAQ